MADLSPLQKYVARIIGEDRLRQMLDAISVKVDDSPGWESVSGRPHDRDPADIQKLYEDALIAWRKNPIAKRIIDITTDYVIGDGITVTAPGQMGRFLDEWWKHPKNHMELRLPDLSDELARAGDLFITFHLNTQDGTSYVRPVPKDRIHKIESLPNDWETEIAYYETRGLGETFKWLSPDHPNANAEGNTAIMVHYAVNRPIGALMGEGDLVTMLPWLKRYSRMLEDRVRLNWAMRAFLWMVTVPSNKVKAKIEQYKTAPEAGSVIVKDEAETWESVAPMLHAYDANYDLRAVRRMIDSGSGYPPHWRGEPENANLATAEAMQDPAIRHLRRRQQYIKYMLTDLAYISYSRAYTAGKIKTKPNRDAIKVNLPDISREDNRALAESARNMSIALDRLIRSLGTSPNDDMRKLMVHLTTKFAGETLTEEEIEALVKIAETEPTPTPPAEAENGE